MSRWFLPGAAGLLWAGIASRALLEAFASPAVAFLALAACILVAAWTWVRGIGLGQIMAGALAVFLLGAAWGAWRTEAVTASYLASRIEVAVGEQDGDHTPWFAGGRVEAQLTGTLRTDPNPGRYGWSAVLHVSRVDQDSMATQVREAVWVSADGPVPRALGGAGWVVPGALERPDDADFASFLTSRGIGVIARVDSMRTLGPPADPFTRLASSARSALQGAFARLFEPREGGLLMGLILGDTTGLDPGVERDFRATGLSHLLAVSGGNVAMVLAPVLALLALLRAPPSLRFAVAIGVVAFFVVLTGAEPSVLRAGVMAGIALTGVFLGRARDTGSVLAGSVLILLLLDPFLADTVGFQLSVAATAGLALMAGPLTQRLEGWVPKPIALAVAATLAAQIGVAPLLLVYFRQIPLVAIPANVLAFAAIGPAMLLGLAAAAASAVAPWLGAALVPLAELPLIYLRVLADSMATLPLPSLTSGGGVGALIIGGAVAAVAFWWVRLERRSLPRRVQVGLVALVPLLLIVSAARAGPPEVLTVRFFDVGQGDAALISSPAGANILVDGGPDEDLVATKLAVLGIKRLDAVIGSHAHEDHLVGLPAVLSRYPVGVVMDPGCEGSSSAYRAFLDAAAEEALELRHPRVGESFTVGDVRIELLGPAECAPEDDENNDSLVFRVSVAGDSVLFTGCSEVPTQEQMLRDGIDVSADVLKVPHHGGDTSAPEFFDAVAASVGTISSGADNHYGHPDPHLLEMVAEAGTRAFRTDRPGEEDIVVSFEPEGVAVRYEAA